MNEASEPKVTSGYFGDLHNQLVAVLDLFSRWIVGWTMSQHCDTAFVQQALRMACSQRQPHGNLLHYSDRSSTMPLTITKRCWLNTI